MQRRKWSGRISMKESNAFDRVADFGDDVDRLFGITALAPLDDILIGPHI